MNYKQNNVTAVYPLPQRHVQSLVAALADTLSSLTDVEGTGSSLISAGSRLRRIYGHGGVDVALTFSKQDDGTNNQLRMSGESLQPLVTASTNLNCGKLTPVQNVGKMSAMPVHMDSCNLQCTGNLDHLGR